MLRSRFFLLMGVFIAGSALLTFAQTASIQGTVFDKAGAVVTGAEIVVTNIGTGQVRTATSSGTGFYSITTLPVGAYQIEIKKESFKGFKVQNAQLTVAQVLTVNATLVFGVAIEVLHPVCKAVIANKDSCRYSVVNDRELPGL